jgi:hypothetical protein
MAHSAVPGWDVRSASGSLRTLTSDSRTAVPCRAGGEGPQLQGLFGAPLAPSLQLWSSATPPTTGYPSACYGTPASFGGADTTLLTSLQVTKPMKKLKEIGVNEWKTRLRMSIP